MIQFQGEEIGVLIDFENKVNAMTPAFVTKLGFTTRLTDVGAQKIDGSLLKTYRIVTASFSIWDKLAKLQFFKLTFLLVNTNIEVVIRISSSFSIIKTSSLQKQEDLPGGVIQLQGPCLLANKFFS